MTRAIWNGTVIAESERCVLVEGNRYFPPQDVRREFLQPSETRTVCPWKGTASYYDVVANGQTNKDAAWCYPATKPEARHIEGYIAFWHGVKVEG